MYDTRRILEGSKNIYQVPLTLLRGFSHPPSHQQTDHHHWLLQKQKLYVISYMY